MLKYLKLKWHCLKQQKTRSQANTVFNLFKYLFYSLKVLVKLQLEGDYEKFWVTWSQTIKTLSVQHY